MKEVKLRAIPENENILFIKKLYAVRRSLINVPSFVSVKFAITDKAIYTRQANVLIPFFGTQRHRVDEVKTLKINNYFNWANLRYFKIITIFNEDFELRLNIQDVEEITKILLELNSNIVIQDESTIGKEK